MIKNETKNLCKDNLIDHRERKRLSEHLLGPRTTSLYELSKINNLFETFPPIQSIASG